MFRVFFSQGLARFRSLSLRSSNLCVTFRSRDLRVTFYFLSQFLNEESCLRHSVFVGCHFHL